MTESYSAEAVIKKFYQSEDETPKNGSHLPFNFQMIKLLNNETTAAEFVKMVTDWIKVLPKGKVTNWVVSQQLITRNYRKANNYKTSTDWQSRSAESCQQVRKESRRHSQYIGHHVAWSVRNLLWGRNRNGRFLR